MFVQKEDPLKKAELRIVILDSIRNEHMIVIDDIVYLSIEATPANSYPAPR